jgi:hypothetical protein
MTLSRLDPTRNGGLSAFPILTNPTPWIPSPATANSGLGVLTAIRPSPVYTMAARPITHGCQSWAASHSSSAARAFLQLAPRRAFHQPSSPLLEFLLPGVPSKKIPHGFNKPTITKLHITGRRSFTTCSARRQTSAVYNPRKDEDGNDMTVEITPRASNVNIPTVDQCDYMLMNI